MSYEPQRKSLVTKSSLTDRSNIRKCVKVDLSAFAKRKEANKGARGMPRLSKKTKDVVSCEKLRGIANRC
jgi:hypothetical protein